MISFIESFQKELEQEAAQTRRMLAVVPADKMDWQPHPKSMTIKALATHLAEIPIMITMGIKADKWDFAESPYAPADYPNAEALLARFEECVQEAQAALAGADDSILQQKWVMCSGDVVYAKMEKWETVRHAFGQNAHHRAQLGVFLRLLDIPVPGPMVRVPTKCKTWKVPVPRTYTPEPNQLTHLIRFWWRTGTSGA